MDMYLLRQAKSFSKSKLIVTHSEEEGGVVFSIAFSDFSEYIQLGELRGVFGSLRSLF